MTKKRTRANGEGSIFRRASDQMWVGALHLPNGRRKAVYGKTKAVVTAKLERLKGEIASGANPQSDERLTLETYLLRWFENEKANLRPNTARTYEGLIRLHIVPAIGSRQLGKLSVQDLERFFAQCTLGPRSVRVVKSVLSAAYSDAVRWGYLSRNPVTYAQAPKLARSTDEGIDIDEVKAILTAFDGQPFDPLIRTAIGSGLRQGELLALRWTDVDFDSGTVLVQATLQRVNGEYVRLDPKTDRSARLVPIANFALTALTEQRSNQTAQRLLTPSWSNALDLVFTTNEGRPLSARVVTKTFQARLAAAGLRTRRFHELRHAYATLLLAQGVDLTTIRDMLGHTDIATSLIYTHVVSDLKRSAVAQLNALLA